MIDFKKSKDFFVGIDSDGCVFDSMELKHKECFIPNFINYFDLQGVSKYAREAAEFVNLYSKSRGINRYPALVEQLDWLRRRPEVIARGVKVPMPESIVNWVKTEKRQNNNTLAEAVKETGDAELKRLLDWSYAVNETVEKMVRNVPPFPSVRKALEKLAPQSDMLVVSATPNEALQREWEEHGIEKYVAAICGQEVGTKAEILVLAEAYPPANRLMIGDAPGDYKAAKATNCLYYPINPGAEEESWQRLHDEAADRFLNGTYAGEYQQQLLDEFEKYLPERPSWPVVE